MNALSFPTWVIHISSILEWIVALALIWQYGERTQNPAWKHLAWGMLPALVGAMAVVVWHYFDNTPALAWLGRLQGAMTLLGNITLMLAGYSLYRMTRTGQT
ncbi:DUF2499 domain-containing protein [Candidatus Cyanaurora vandensis]|uniref:DUF2499 domain-containing protein n=1 Tax=Candidatus Cyanaurora vandensis TaxID=2714958 RepID=UPI00257CBBEB|nr:DUF2499 domain-containing protein [Candidatus Cyanaurora vandensis]